MVILWVINTKRKKEKILFFLPCFALLSPPLLQTLFLLPPLSYTLKSPFFLWQVSIFSYHTLLDAHTHTQTQFFPSIWKAQVHRQICNFSIGYKIEDLQQSRFFSNVVIICFVSSDFVSTSSSRNFLSILKFFILKHFNKPTTIFGTHLHSPITNQAS